MTRTAHARSITSPNLTCSPGCLHRFAQQGVQGAARRGAKRVDYDGDRAPLTLHHGIGEEERDGVRPLIGVGTCGALVARERPDLAHRVSRALSPRPK